MEYALSQGATGFIARTDWECMTEGTALDGVNKLNLYGAARLSYDPATDFGEIYQEWLAGPVSTAFSDSDIPTHPGIPRDAGRSDIKALKAVLEEETWPVLPAGLPWGLHVPRVARRGVVDHAGKP